MGPPQPLPSGRFRRALLGLHNTEQDAGLLAYVRVLVRAGVVSEVVCVHVVPDADDPPALERMVVEMKAAAAPYLGALPGLPPVVYEGRTGPLLDQLLEAVTAHRADLALIGHRQDHPLRRSLARRLAKLAPCSVWLVPNGSPPAITRVLVPIDFSPTAGHALGTAVALAPRVGLSGVTAVHVHFDESRTTYEGADAVVRGREEEAFAAFVAPLGETGVRVSPVFRESVSPAHAIREVADELAADLVVMGTRGRTPSAAILLGSVAQETLVESRVPVLVVKAPGAQVGLFRALLERLSHHEPGAQFD